MKIQLNHQGGSPSPERPDPIAEAREMARRIEAKKSADRRTAVRAIMIGGFALIAVFACLEVLKPGTKSAESVEAKLLREREQAKAAAKAAATTAPDPGPSAIAGGDSGTGPAEVTPPPVTPAPVEEPVAKSESELIAAEANLILTGPESQRDAAIARDRALLKRAVDGKAWDAYRGLLGRSIKAAITQLPNGQGLNRFDPVWNEPVLYQALLRWRVLGWFPQSQITTVVEDSYSGSMWLWLLNKSTAMEELLLTMRPEDDPAAVLKFLSDAWPVNEPKYEKYFPLAVACAVVFDRPVSIPHPVGKVEYGVEQTVEPMKRYLWYVEKNEKGKLAAPVHHSSARDLVWVVCAPVTTSELEWAIDKLHYRRKNWGDAYGSIEYLMERAVEGLNPYKEYSFAEIQKEGGICGDQSYFCVNTARAQGIPAMTIAGETDSGGHAWAGLKIDDREWTTGVGRIGGASKGMAGNPQTGGSITEQEIQLWNDRYHQSPTVTLSVFRHLWLADYFAANENDDDHGATVRLANRVGHTFVETWKALYSLLESEMQLTGEPAVPSNLDEWKSFAADMRREFKDNPRMAELAANAEMEYIFPYGEDGDAKRLLMRERRRIERDSGEQKDLIASSLKREAELIVRRGGPDVKKDISRLYDRALRDFGGSVTAFRMMAEDYYGHMRGDPELARKAARDIELAFKRVVETGTKDWFRANAESGLYRMICGYYREAGDTARADMLEKRIEVLLKRSKRSAL